MVQPTLDVVDANDIIRTIFTINPNGRAAAAASQPVTISTEDKAVLDAIAASVAGTITVGGTVAATQSGTWNITNVSGTISLPTGAATAAKQPALGTAGTASADVLTVQGRAGMVPLDVNATFTPSGTQDTNITKIGGNAVTTTLPVSGTITIGAGSAVIGHVITDTGSTTAVTGTVAVSGPLTDTQLRATAVPVSGTVAATQSGTWNITNISGTVSLPTGAATAALQTQPGVDIGDVTVNNASGAAAVNIQDGGNSITVDGTFWQATQPVSIAGTVTVSGTVAATQSGTWNITNISGTISLPTGASTSALQTTGNTSLSSIDSNIDILAAVAQTADTSSGGAHGFPALFIRKDSPANGASVDGYYDYPQMSAGRIWTSTVITSGSVSVSSSALPTGASTAAKQPALGTAGTASSDVITIQGITSMTPLLVTATLSGNGAVNLTQLIGNAVSVGNGVTGTGVLRVAQVSDGTGKLSSVDNITNPVTVVGATATGNAKSGNPVQTGAVFTTTQPTVASGSIVESQATTRGAHIVAPGVEGFAVTIAAGAAVIGHVITDTGSTTAVTGNVTVTQATGTNLHVVLDTTSTTAVTQATGTNLHMVVDSGTITTVSAVTAITNALPTGTNTLGSIKITDGTTVAGVIAGNSALKTDASSINGTTIVTGGVAGSQSVGGTVATNVAITANPLNLGAQAVSSENAAVTTARQVQLVADLVGKLIVLPYANPENFVSGTITSAMTGTASTLLLAAPASGLRNYITSITVSNSSAAIGTDVIIQDGNGGTTLYVIPAAANYGGATITFPVPLRQPTTATAIYCANVTTASSTKVSAVSYKGI